MLCVFRGEWILQGWTQHALRSRGLENLHMAEAFPCWPTPDVREIVASEGSEPGS